MTRHPPEQNEFAEPEWIGLVRALDKAGIIDMDKPARGMAIHEETCPAIDGEPDQCACHVMYEQDGKIYTLTDEGLIQIRFKRPHEEEDWIKVRRRKP